MGCLECCFRGGRANLGVALRKYGFCYPDIRVDAPLLQIWTAYQHEMLHVVELYYTFDVHGRVLHTGLVQSCPCLQLVGPSRELRVPLAIVRRLQEALVLLVRCCFGYDLEAFWNDSGQRGCL